MLICTYMSSDESKLLSLPSEKFVLVSSFSDSSELLNSISNTSSRVKDFISSEQ